MAQSYRTLSSAAVLNSTGVSAGSYGSGALVPVITVGTDGRITAVTTSAVSGGGGASVVVSDTAPASPSVGNIWFDSSKLNTYVYYNDGDSSQWVNATSVSVGTILPTQTGNTGKYLTTDGSTVSWATFTGYAGSAGYTGSTGYTGSASTAVGYTGSSGAAASTPAAVSDQQNTSTGYFALSVGTTAQRPASPANGYMRFNTTTGFGEVYNATAAQWLSFGTSPTLSVEYLVVAGGGGGGGIGGGGGGGGFLAGSLSAILTSTLYSITVGGGGPGGNGGDLGSTPTGFGVNGNDSNFAIITSAGGGGGGSWNSSRITGADGGSGGGGAARGSQAGGLGNVPATTPSQGNNGGISLSGNTSVTGRGGGGGGAGDVGATGDASGNGGIGTQSSITGTATYYAGGGGGGGFNPAAGGTGGTGGGGAGSSYGAVGGAATANTGGGGGGSSANQGAAPYAGGAGGAGGSGIVILKYSSTYTASFSGGLTASTTTSGAFKISSVTAGTGTVTFS